MMTKIAAAVLAATVAWTSGAAAADKVTATIAAFSEPIYAPYFIARAKGYFVEQGLDVELKHAGGGVATPALISGTLEFSTSSGSAISAIVKGAPLKVVMTMSESVPWKLWATGPDIKSLSDLKGKAVAIATRGDLLEVSVRAALLKEGLPPDWVTFTPLGLGVQQRMAVLKSAIVPAVVVDNTSERVAREGGLMGASHMIYDIGKKIQTPFLGLATRNDLLAAKPDLVKRFIKAAYMGLMYMKAYPEGTLRVIKEIAPNAKDELVLISIRETIPEMLDAGEAGIESQKGEIAVRREILNMPKDGAQAPGEVFDYTLVRAARAELHASGWKPTE
jgi:NitT/TauT family transport system substrate-binding protein